MPHAPDLLTDLAVVLGVAALATAVCRLLRLPVLLGYLVAGMAVGPHTALPLFADVTTTQELAEVGVVLLMFTLGLGFRVRKLVRSGLVFGIITALEVGLMLMLGTAAVGVLGWGRTDALVAGAVVAISSTMIIAREFDEQQAPAPLQRLVFGILVFEDLVAILLLVLIGTGGSRGGEVALGPMLLRLGAFVVGSLAVGLLVLPPLLKLILRFRRADTTLVAAVALAFAAAVAARSAGYSVALGAFLAGSVAAEAGAGPVFSELLRPLRDMFAAIFFVAIGMQFDPGMLPAVWPAVLVLSVLVVAGKAVGVSVATFLTGHGTRLSLRAGLSMTQIGEFSLIVAAAAVAQGGASERVVPTAIGIAVVTAALSPVLMRRADRMALAVDRRLPPALQTIGSLSTVWGEALRRGFGGGGSGAPAVARLTRLLVLDVALLISVLAGVLVNAEAVGAWLALATRLDERTSGAVVVAAGLLLALPFGWGVSQLVPRLAGAIAARVIRPPARAGAVDPGRAPRMALTAMVTTMIGLMVLLPLAVVAETSAPAWGPPMLLATGALVLGAGLWRSGRDLHGHVRAGSELVAAALVGDDDERSGALPLSRVADLLPGLGEFIPARLDAASPGAGRSLGVLNVRGATGATIVAIRRAGEAIVAPSSEQVLQAGDLLVLSGTTRAVTEAMELLGARVEAAEDHG